MPPEQNQPQNQEKQREDNFAVQETNIQSPFPKTEEQKSPAPDNQLGQDIARILQEVTLPKRKEFQAAGDTPPTPAQPPQPSPIEMSRENPGSVKPTNETVIGDLPEIHTIKDDLHSLVAEQQMSMVKAAALEEERRARMPQEKNTTAKKRVSSGVVMKSIITGLVLVSLGVMGLFAISLVETTRNTAQDIPVPTIMFTEQTLSFPIEGLSSRELRAQLIAARAQLDLSLGAIGRLVPMVAQTTALDSPLRMATTQEFFRMLGAIMPDSLTRAFDPEFFLGFHAVNENMPILVIPVVSYERAFAGMLEWESVMNDQLTPFFTPVPAQTIDVDGTITARKFEDAVIQNYDVRLVKDSQGNVRLLYAFPTRDILIIVESPHSFVEVLSRLRAERRL